MKLIKLEFLGGTGSAKQKTFTGPGGVWPFSGTAHCIIALFIEQQLQNRLDQYTHNT